MNYSFFKNYLSKINVSRLKKDWASFMNNRNKPFWLEKSPPNTMRISWLNVHFKDALFIGVHRNGLAVTEGIKRKVKKIHSFSDYALHWKLSNEILLEQLEGVENKLVVSYEDVVSDPNSFLKTVCDLLNESYSKTAFDKLKVHEYSEGIRDFNEEAIGRLSEDEVTLFNKKASSMMKKLGYSKDAV